MADQPVSARDLLDRGAYAEAAEAFLAVREFASAARAFVCAKAFKRAAECYVYAEKPLDAARLFMLTKDWRRAADLYTQVGDTARTELALQQHRMEVETARAAAQPKPDVPPPPPPPEEIFPEGEIWQAMKASDYPGAAQIYLRLGSSAGWTLLEETRNSKAIEALGETLFQARDYAVAADAFRRCGDSMRSAQCLGLAGLNEEAAHFFVKCGQRTLAAQHLEKAHAWEQAAEIYREDRLYLDAARCQERADDPVRAAALYLKAKRPDLALPLLQGIPPRHKQYAQCRLLAGKILFQKGQHDLALGMLGPLMQLELQGDERIEIFYQVALLLETAGEGTKAQELYGMLQKNRFDYKDVTARLGRLAASAPPVAPPVSKQASRVAPVEPKAAPPSTAAAPLESPERKPARAPESLAPIDLTPLRDCSLFHRLDLEELRRLWGIGRVADISPGKVLLKAGQPVDGLFVILAGGLTITPDPDNLDLAVGFLGTSDYVGLGCLVQGPPRANALVAQGKTRILFLPAKSLEALLSTEPDLGMRLFRSVAEHLSQTLMAQQKR